MSIRLTKGCAAPPAACTPGRAMVPGRKRKKEKGKKAKNAGQEGGSRTRGLVTPFVETDFQLAKDSSERAGDGSQHRKGRSPRFPQPEWARGNLSAARKERFLLFHSFTFLPFTIAFLLFKIIFSLFRLFTFSLGAVGANSQKNFAFCFVLSAVCITFVCGEGYYCPTARKLHNKTNRQQQVSLWKPSSATSSNWAPAL